MMAMTSDQNYMMVGHDDSQLVTVYDLNALQPVTPILMPGGHFARSIAVSSNASILALARNEGAGQGGTAAAGIVDTVQLRGPQRAPLWRHWVFSRMRLRRATGVLASSPSGGDILLAEPDGIVALYTASANTFVNSRQDFTSLSGAFAASDYGSLHSWQYDIGFLARSRGSGQRVAASHVRLHIRQRGRIYGFSRVCFRGRQRGCR